MEQPTVEELLEQLARERAEKERILLASRAEQALKERNLPQEFSRFIMAENAEGIDVNADLLAGSFAKAVAAEVAGRLRGASPKAGNVEVPARPEDMSDEDYYKTHLK